MTQQIVEIPIFSLEMMIGLREAELKTLLFIMHQTQGQNREDVALTYTNFVEGIIDKNGVLATRPSGLCSRSVARALLSLEDKGYIRRVRRPLTHTGSWGSPPVTDIYGLGYRMRPLREWAGDSVVPQPEPIPFRPRRLKALLDAAANSA